MADSEAGRELELVKQAILLGRRFHGCCEWDERTARRVEERPPCLGMTPKGIKDLLLEFVASEVTSVRQVVEQRSDYYDRQFYYKVLLPVQEFPLGLFVELILTDDAPDCPSVLIVNAHEQLR